MKPGDLVRLKTQLFWHDVLSWDGNPGRVCLVLAVRRRHKEPSASTTNANATTAAHLMIDGLSRWAWVAEQDVEVIE